MSQGNGFGDCKCYPPSAEAANAVSFHAGGVPGLAERTAERRDRTLISGPSCIGARVSMWVMVDY